MKKRLKLIALISGVLMLFLFVGMMLKNGDFNGSHSIGQPIDSLNGVKVFFNGGVDNISGRNLTNNGYNIGLKYQCVEFVKRYYYKRLQHEMPNSYGDAKDFYSVMLKDGGKNHSRNLCQYSNPSKTKPKIDDIIVFSGTFFNRFGHVAIVSAVTDKEIEIVQQNSGLLGNSRGAFPLVFQNNKWKVDNSSVLGWLRKDK